MRIVYMLNSLGVGGAERLALTLADRKARRGNAVAVLVLLPPIENEWATDLRVVPLDMGSSPWSVLVGVVRARRFLCEFQPDLIHSHRFHANILARLLRLFVPSARVLTTVHNVYEVG
jgi:glycosyltransferase involved in cell wall biosynthesis